MKGLLIAFQGMDLGDSSTSDFELALSEALKDLADRHRIEFKCSTIAPSNPVTHIGGAPLANTRVAKGHIRPDTSDEF